MALDTERRRLVIEIVLLMVLVINAMLVIYAICSRPAEEPKAIKVNGQPLDAHEIAEYDRPVWLPDCVRCWKVTDRGSGKKFWLLQFADGSYVTEEAK
ncbi:MAG: hypothetical protein IJ943_03665 [Akkermansia sp.]|nr:hypothetical protein [Akkermansia sp.]MBR2683085.1 hypothetical protein [Atopobiaceae bacterium]MBR3387506.1 hypothetical protein [Bacteroidales bacterium]